MGLRQVHILLSLAWLARLRGLGLHSLWLDEALEYARASSSLDIVLRSRLVDLDPPFYSLFMHFWVRIGVNDFLVRFPSAAFGVVATALMVTWLRRHGPMGFALLGGLIFALAPVQIHYAQELNQYGLVGLLSVATLLAFDCVLARGRWRDWMVFAVVGAVDMFSYYGLLWLLAAVGAYWVVRFNLTSRPFWGISGNLSHPISPPTPPSLTRVGFLEAAHRLPNRPPRPPNSEGSQSPDRGFPPGLGGQGGWLGGPEGCLLKNLPLQVPPILGSTPASSDDSPQNWGAGGAGLRSQAVKFLTCQAIFALTALALLPFSLEGHILRGLAAWTGQYAQLGRGDVLQQLTGALHSSLVLFALFPFGDPPDLLVIAVYALLVLGAITLMRREAQQVTLLLAVLTLGPALAFVASGLGLYPFQGRHLLFAAPALYTLLAAGLWSLRRFRFVFTAAIAGAALSLVAFWTIPIGPAHPRIEVTSREELRPVLAQVREAFQAGDAIYVYYAARAAYKYYQDAGLAPPVTAFVEDGWPNGRLAPQLQNIRIAARGHSRLWLVFAHLSEDEDAALAEELWLNPPHWLPVGRIEAENAAAYLLERPPCTNRCPGL